MAGVQPGSIHGPLSCNLFINDVSFFHFCTLSNYTDNNKLFTTATVMKLINQILSSDFRSANNWFYENLMILHPGKCHFMSIGKVCMMKIVLTMITLHSEIAMKDNKQKKNPKK